MEEYIRNAFKSLEDLKVVIEPVKKPIFEDVEAAPVVDDSDKTVKDLFDEAGSYILTHEFDDNGTTYYLFMEGLQDGESCDILFDEFDISNITEVLVEILDEEHDFIDSLHMEDVSLDSAVSSVISAASNQLSGAEENSDETSVEGDNPEDYDTNVRDFVGDGPDEEGEPAPEEGELPPAEIDQEPEDHDINDAPVEEALDDCDWKPIDSFSDMQEFAKNSVWSVKDERYFNRYIEAGYKFYGCEKDGHKYLKSIDQGGKEWGPFDENDKAVKEALNIDINDTVLNEEAKFNLQDEEEVKEAEAVLNKDDDEAIEQIVDAAAETIDDLQKTYIGSIILQCPTCKTMIYKNPDQLVKAEGADEEEEIYNVDEECPHCGAKDGFELIGQVASLDVNPDGVPNPPMDEQPEEPKEEEPKEEEQPEASKPAEPMPALPDEEKNEELEEDTVKQGDKWVNKGKEGTHGEFKTKKAADAQRRAIWVNWDK